MKRSLTLALLAAALLLAGGAALAQDVGCTGGECRGTVLADEIQGTEGNGQVFGLGGADVIVGDSQRIGGSDLIRGGGPDLILNATIQDQDAVFGGKGNDTIDVREGVGGGADVVDCGDGRATVFVDPDDKATSCERKNPEGDTSPI